MVSEEVLKYTIRLKMHSFYSDLYRSRGIRRIFCWPNTDVPVDLYKNKRSVTFKTCIRSFNHFR